MIYEKRTLIKHISFIVSNFLIDPQTILDRPITNLRYLFYKIFVESDKIVNILLETDYFFKYVQLSSHIRTIREFSGIYLGCKLVLISLVCIL